MSSSVEFALEMRNIRKDFPGVQALKDVTLEVRRGEVHALLGENGAGKSTLMKILSGVYPAGTYMGEVRVNGVPVRLHSPHDAQVKGIGFVPQEISVIEPLTVAENIFVGHLNAKSNPFVRFKAVVTRAQTFLTTHGIQLNARERISNLAAAQRQLVMIARALSRQPSVLILDEPTSSLNAPETRNLFRIVRHLRDQGASIIFITHKLDEVMELADRVTVLRDGAIANRFDREHVDQNEIIAAMIGRKLSAFFPVRNSRPRADVVLDVEGLTVTHARRNISVLEDVRFTLHAGEILGVVGLIGSGQSELLNALYGRVPYRGRILVNGKEVKITSPRVAKAHGIGFLPEERKRQGLLFNFGVAENISINNLAGISRWAVLNRGHEERQARSFMSSLAIRAPGPSTRVLHLSGGNQQKVVLAKTLVAQPKVLLLHEPTKGVDIGAKAEIYDLIFELVRQGIALIVASSELPELLAVCDRFLVLAEGKIADAFGREDATEHRAMRAATGVAGSKP